MGLKLVLQASADSLAISEAEQTWLGMCRLRLREAGCFLLQNLDCERFRHVVFISKLRPQVNFVSEDRMQLLT